MGSGLAGGPLTGGPVNALASPTTGGTVTLTGPITSTAFTGPAGASAVLVGPLGTGATDVVTKAGSSAALASVNTAAELFRVCAGIGGTESGRLAVYKGAQADGFELGAPSVVGRLTIDNSAGWALKWSTTSIGVDGTNVTIAGSVYGGVVRFNCTTGACAVDGTDSSGTPGAATINKPSGKSAIAAAAAGVVITNSLVTAASRVMFSPETRDTTCKELIAVPAAGSFTVSGTAAATAALVFSWEVVDIF